jgi:inner membrane protein
MPSSISHAAAAVTIAAAILPRRAYRVLAVVGVVCVILPDVDALPRLIGRADIAALGGHRGFTHSITFAVALAGLLMLGPWQKFEVPRWTVFSYVAVATLSHGVLDAFSDYGSGVGVAFLSPFYEQRFKAPWQPIAGEFSELFFCLLPLVVITGASLRLRKLEVGVHFRENPVQLGIHTVNSQPSGESSARRTGN